jgi:hypothetical protein
MNNPFEIISYWLSQKSMTATEKKLLRERIVSYATTHPVKTGLMSPYAFRFVGVACASLLLVLGGSIGITKASMTALPYQTLYPVKLWVEEFRSNNQPTIEAQIAFETKRLETRFDEAATLAVGQSLDESRALLVQAGIETSQTKIKQLALNLELQQPEASLDALNSLESTLTTSGKLLARIESTTGQSVRPIVLAAQVSTERIAFEKTNLEKLVALQPNEMTQDATVKQFILLQEKINTLKDSQKILALQEIKEKIDQKQYSEALVMIKQLDQKLQQTSLTAKLEAEYNLPKEDPIESEPISDSEIGGVVDDSSGQDPLTPDLNTTDTGEVILETEIKLEAKPTVELIPATKEIKVNVESEINYSTIQKKTT